MEDKAVPKVEITDHVRQCVAKLFSPGEAPEVIRILEDECHDYGERIHCAVLKISRGDIGRLRAAVKESHLDYRDVLMAADFGYDVNAHMKWNGEK